VRGRDAHVAVQHTGATAHSCCGLEGGEDSILSIQCSQNAGGVARKARRRVEHDTGLITSCNGNPLVDVRTGSRHADGRLSGLWSRHDL
jgi:hypothetical protein